MEFSHVVRDNILVIAPQGENLDALTALSFKEGILDFVQKIGLNKIILDFSHLRFIDSSGLGALLFIQRSLHKEGGTVKLVSLNKPIQTMFEIVSMHRILDIFPNVEDAIKSFNS